MKRFWSVAILAAVIGLAGASAHAAKGAKPAKGAGAGAKAGKGAGKGARSAGGVAGIVQKADGNSIVIQTAGKNASEVTIAVDANTKFEVNGAAAAATEIKPGMRVSISPNSGTAQKVTAQSGKAGKAGKGVKGAKKKPK